MNIKVMAYLFLISATTSPAFSSFDATQNNFIKIYIQSIKNSSPRNCVVDRVAVAAEHKVQLAKPIEIPYVSIAKYLREYASKTAYTPEEALKLVTSHGLFRLWASESGVMCAPDPKDNRFSFDNWEAKTLFENTHQRLNGKKTYLTLAVALLNNKLKISLEETRA